MPRGGRLSDLLATIRPASSRGASLQLAPTSPPSQKAGTHQPTGVGRGQSVGLPHPGASPPPPGDTLATGANLFCLQFQGVGGRAGTAGPRGVEVRFQPVDPALDGFLFSGAGRLCNPTLLFDFLLAPFNPPPFRPAHRSIPLEDNGNIGTAHSFEDRSRGWFLSSRPGLIGFDHNSVGHFNLSRMVICPKMAI